METEVQMNGSVTEVPKLQPNILEESTKNSSQVLNKSENAPPKFKTKNKEIVHMMKALSQLKSPEDKINALCEKYSALHHDYLNAQELIKQAKKRENHMQREISRSQNDKTKLTVANSRLENLARELQKRNNAEEQKVKEMADKLKSSLGDAELQMKKAVESNEKLSNDYTKIKKEFEDLAAKNKIRDKKIEGALEQYKVEVKLMTVEHKKKSLEMERDLEKEKILRRQLTQKCIEQNEAFEVQQKLVSSLQQQIKFYEKKFGEVQSMLTKSHDTCTSLADQHDKMKKRLSAVQSERSNLQHKLEVKSKLANQAIKQNEKTATKQGKLEKLCRALQQERSQLNKQLKLLESQLSSSTSSDSVSKSKTDGSNKKAEKSTTSIGKDDKPDDDIVIVEVNDKTNKGKTEDATKGSVDEEKSSTEKDEVESSDTVQLVPEAVVTPEENNEPNSIETVAVPEEEGKVEEEPKVSEESKITTEAEKPNPNEAVPTESSSDAVENSIEKYEDLD